MRTGAARIILLVDDHPAVRRGLALVLTEEGIGNCREVASREVAELCGRNIPVLVCSMHEEPGYIRRALVAGARGYISKREPPRVLARAVREILEGWMLISPRAAEGLRGD